MTCPHCGDICRCASPGDQPVPDADQQWRQEVAARLNRYQKRRPPRPPRYPSLRLPFDQDSPRAAGPSAQPDDSPTLTAPFSHQALALQQFAPESVAEPQPDLHIGQEESRTAEPSLSSAYAAPATAPITAKIIEFPRSWTPAPPPLDELAEPVLDCPRILEAPDVVPQPPALGGITIEAAHQPETGKRPGIDVPLQAAPLAQRIAAAAIDASIVTAACALFGYIFWKLTAIRPPRFQVLELTAGLAALFWAAYQYLLVVYSGSTPGLRLAQLQLARFDGTPAHRSLRRWRVLASFLSAVSLGMGYAWVFLDEDSLCWHDRTTHTYLAPRPRQTTDPVPASH